MKSGGTELYTHKNDWLNKDNIPHRLKKPTFFGKTSQVYGNTSPVSGLENG